MNLDKAKKQFDKLILQSLENTQYIIPNTVYYNESYYAQLVKELKKRNLFKNLQDKELQEVAPGLIKMCSVASSSRLCFINFANKNEIIFERPLSTGKGTARLDASKDNLFYECKCHEIFDKHNDYLSLSYIENLKDFFNINYQKTDTNYCKLNLTDFGIENKESIYSLHFDMKQLLCHLFGIARNGGGTLQYIFFTPKKELIENNEFCRNMYKELENEIDQIWHCEKITMMINNFKIKLPHPQMIDVSSIEDVVLKNMELTPH